MNRWFTALLAVVFTTSLAFGSSSGGGSPWYFAASGGYSSGWSAEKDFVFSSGPIPGTVGPAFAPLVQSASTRAMPVGTVAFGYAWARSGGWELRGEIEGVYQPQEFEIRTTGAPFSLSPLPSTHTTREDDFGALVNFGGVFSQSRLKPMLMVGLGANTSKAAGTSPLWQVKAGVAWAISDTAALTAEARYLGVSSYSVEGSAFGPYASGRQYDFGSVGALAGTIGVRVRF